MKKYALTLSTLTLMTILGVSSASAMKMGMMANTDPEQFAKQHTEMFQKTATLFGISIADAKNYWIAGKDVRDIAKEKGISDADLKTKLNAQREADMKTSLQTLVTKGILTQAEADSRFATMKTKMQNKEGKGKGRKMF
jgi:hypothetical protein